MLQVKNISFKYTKKSVLENIDFTVNPGENLAIIGESGCGKSTLLKLIYGFYDLSHGETLWKTHKILGPKDKLVVGHNFMKYVSQEFDLMPFTSVEENIGTHLSRFYLKEKQKRTDELIKIVELQDFAKVKVKNLSGGQKQRVAIARALAKQPEILLLDEPFSHIDNFKKQSLRRSIFKHLKENNITCIVATHDKEDVLGFSDRMIVLNNNKIVANDIPENLYNNPKTPLVASFFGEFNIINDTIIYAHELKTIEQSNMKVTVKNVYFKGHYYLNEATLSDKTVFFESTIKLIKGTKVFLKSTKN